KGETNFFTSQMIKDCMKKVVAVNLHETVRVDDQLEIKCYYAGHVLGAAMFHIRVGQQSVVYTGDYNMTPDRHLGSAWIDKCRPDLLITESTYATTIRDSKRCRERDFLMKVHECIEKGGKVLIPVFALGRAQELCILLETYWERMNLKAPIYFAMGLTEKATNYYKLFITWTNQKIKKTFVQKNMFDFKYIKPFDRSYSDNPGPMVVFATPGMLHSGLSLHLFKKWAPNENNMAIMPGFCVSGTVGHKILNGAKKVEFENKQSIEVKMSVQYMSFSAHADAKVEFENKQSIEVKMSVQYMSFSAHADAKGIMTLIQQCEPKNVLLVHGEASKMEFLHKKIKQEFQIECYMPANGETVTIDTKVNIPVDVEIDLLKRSLNSSSDSSDPKRPKLLHGTLMMTNTGTGPQFRLVDPSKAMQELGIKPHIIQFTSTVRLKATNTSPQKITEFLFQKLKNKLCDQHDIKLANDCSIIASTAMVRVNNGSTNDVKDVYISWSDHVSSRPTDH
ncbi:unnamed protein product, partial [Medioppia subpectinata]